MLAFLTCWFLFFHAFAAAEGGSFYNPPPMQSNHDYSNNQVYKLGKMVQLRWSTDIKQFDILLWQNNNTNPETLMKNETDRTKYNWLASTQRHLSNGNVFFFHIADSSNHTVFFQSHYFNLTDSSSTSSSSASSSTATATGSGSGLSPQAKVGVGVGVGLGCAFLITLVIVIWYFRRRLLGNSASAVSNRDSAGPYMGTDSDKQYTMPPPGQKLPVAVAPVEAPTETAVEAPAGELRHEVEAPAGVIRHELP